MTKPADTNTANDTTTPSPEEAAHQARSVLRPAWEARRDLKAFIEGVRALAVTHRIPGYLAMAAVPVEGEQDAHLTDAALGGDPQQAVNALATGIAVLVKAPHGEQILSIALAHNQLARMEAQKRPVTPSGGKVRLS